MYVCMYVHMYLCPTLCQSLSYSPSQGYGHTGTCFGAKETTAQNRNEFLKMKKRFKKKKAQNDLVKMHQLQGNHKWCFPLVKFACNCASQVSVKNPIPAHNLLVESSTVKSLFWDALWRTRRYSRWPRPIYFKPNSAKSTSFSFTSVWNTPYCYSHLFWPRSASL